MNLQIGVLYLGLHNQLVKRYGTNVIISRKEFVEATGRHWLIPKNLRPCVLKEMREKKLIEWVDRDNIKILQVKFDLEKEEDVHRLYRMVGLF